MACLGKKISHFHFELYLIIVRVMLDLSICLAEQNCNAMNTTIPQVAKCKLQQGLMQKSSTQVSNHFRSFLGFPTLISFETVNDWNLCNPMSYGDMMQASSRTELMLLTA